MTKILYQKINSNIFDGKIALVNPVNCVGVMGKGLALEFKKRFPLNYINYKNKCDKGLVHFTKPLSYTIENGITIINLPTKYHWKDNSSLKEIKESLERLRELIIEKEFSEIHIPAIGCGLGGLNYSSVVRLLVDMGNNIDTNTTIYLYKPM